MKLIASGVANCAGMTRSPSFSRSSSSTRMNMRPLRASSISSSALERYCDSSADLSVVTSVETPPAARRSGRACRSRYSPDRPARSVPNRVTAAVCGMMFTPKVSSATSLTVNDTPSTATLPLAAMKRARSAGTRKRQRVEPFSGSPRSRVADAVDVAGDEVAAQFVADPQRAFQVDLRADPPGAERGLASVSAEASAANQSGPTRPRSGSSRSRRSRRRWRIAGGVRPRGAR